jgi:lipoyl(octanoyl) transferase
VRRLEARWLGRVSWDDAPALQKDLERRVKACGQEALLLLEHQDVVTLGRNARRGDILATPGRLAQLGVAVRETDRGGQVTYHGPGQLVGYPILSLSPDRCDVRRYVRDLEEVLIRTAADYGVTAGRSPVAERWSSVWVGNDKLAAIGVHLSRWVTTHGFALNVTTDLARFSLVIPCGIQDGGVTSIQRITGRTPTVEEVARRAAHHFASVFARDIVSRPGPGAEDTGAARSNRP